MRRFEEFLLAILLIAFVLFMLWLLTGCASSVNRAARMKYNSTKNCVWEVTGAEAMVAKNILQDFYVGPDCVLHRKTSAGVLDNVPEEPPE